MIKDFMTAYWGLLPTTSKPYPASEKVNAFVGPSGHGKTTIWDGLRVVLGDTTFESKRKVENYVHPMSNWAIVRVAFHNLFKDSKRPFEKHGFFEDEVVICCRIHKNTDGRWNKEYYIFDGEFTDILDLASNHKSYKQKLKTQEEYRRILEDCLGITPAFRKLMAMNPESVRDMVKYSPNDLFKKIFELKGIKEVQDKYQSAKETLANLEIECESAEKDLLVARDKFEDYKDKVEKYNKFKENETQFNILSLRMKKLEYHEQTSEIENFRREIFEKEQSIERETSNLIQIKLKCSELKREIDNIEDQMNKCRKEYELYNKKVDEITPSLVTIRSETVKLEKKIEKLNSFEGRDINELEERFRIICEERKTAEYYLTDARNKLKEYILKQKALKEDRQVYPDFVLSFLKNMSQSGIEHLMLADAISIKPEFKKWQKAVEAYLGNNRFRIIVNNEQYIETKRLQERFKYTARVSLPKVCDLKINKKHDGLLSIFDVIEIAYPEKTSGYLQGLQEIFLVDTVEEGDALQRRGLVSITREGLLQDNDGAIFRKHHSLCCGKLAISVEAEQVKEDIKTLEQEIGLLSEKATNLIEKEESLEVEIHTLREFDKLPQYKEKFIELNQRLLASENELNDAKSKRDNAINDKEKLHNVDVEKNREFTQCEGLGKVKEKLISDYTIHIGDINKKISSKEQEVKAIRLELLNKGLTEEDIAFIEEDVKTDVYLDELGEIIKSSTLKTRCGILSNEINNFKAFYPDINEKVITLYNAQNSRVVEMTQNLQALRNRRDEWNSECITSLEDLRQHIKLTIKEYIDEFQKLAVLLKANAEGRLEERGEDPEYWELYLKIGYDGKKTTLIDGPELSSGQKACTSLMLLLAAINDRKEGMRVPIMFLDEPKSRLDDSRGNEVGTLLQLTDIQYFITHQQGESLKYIDWINHCFSVSVCKPGEQFAPPIMFQRMRTV